MHGIVSGKTITEDAVPEKVREHIRKTQVRVIVMKDSLVRVIV